MSWLDLLLYIFCGVTLINILFYCIGFSRIAFIKPRSKSNNTHPVSVIVCAKNEAKNLNRFLPLIIAQNYPKFEIVLINDASSDDTLDVMEDFATQHQNIKIVNVENIEAFWGNKKYALTLGIKAAKYQHLLFTDADCMPLSKAWISEMAAQFSEKKSIVLGYGAYHKIKGSFLNKLIRFETVLTAMQYLSFAKLGLPYMAVGRNLAYHKSEFFKVNGFINHMNIRSGDDDLFVNEVANAKNTTICLTKHSFTSSVPKTTFSSWFRQKRRHVSTASYYKFHHKALLALFYISQFLFWALALLLLILNFNLPVVLIAIGIRFLAQYLVIGYSAKTLNETDLIWLFPFLEITLISLQLSIFITNLFIKPKHWN